MQNISRCTKYNFSLDLTDSYKKNDKPVRDEGNEIWEGMGGGGGQDKHKVQRLQKENIFSKQAPGFSYLRV
jgi:hypothetical protein